MVAKRRLLFAITTAASLVLAAAAPMSAGYKNVAPDPLRNENLLRVHDIVVTGASSKFKHGPVAAVGWREGSKPARLWVTYSLTGGKSYAKKNGLLRKAPIAGEFNTGMSLDVCGGRIWVGTALNLGEGKGATDVLLSSRNIVGNSGSQGRLTATASDRKVRGVSVACVDNRLLAIGWLERSGGKERVRLMLRSLELPTKKASFQRLLRMGPARFNGAMDVAATGEAVHVAWLNGAQKKLAYRRVLIGGGKSPEVSRDPKLELDAGGAGQPKLAARAAKVVVGYTDAGRVKVKLSGDRGVSFDKADVIIEGTAAKPSKLHSVDTARSRIVVGASANRNGKLVSTRVLSSDLGETWSTTSFGSNGTRLAALLKRSGKDPLVRMVWHNNNRKGKDTLRSRFERS